MSPLVKIHFNIEQDEDGYPPVGVESLWAKSLGDFFEIDSIPFFTSDATAGDVVRAERDANGELWFAEVEWASTNSLIRIVFFDIAHTDVLTAELQALGCGTEGMTAYKLLAVDIPEAVNLAEVQDLLRQEASAGHVDWEEALLRH